MTIQECDCCMEGDYKDVLRRLIDVLSILSLTGH